MVHYRRALEIDPDFAPAMAHLARSEARAQRNVDGDERRLARADALVGRALALDPSLPSVLEAAADLRGNRFDYRGAAELYRRLIDDRPRDHQLWDQLCWSLGYAVPPQLEEATAACDRALALQPDFHPAFYHRSRVHALAGRLGAARADLDRLEVLAPRSTLAASGRYWVAMAAGTPAEALAALEPLPRKNLELAWRAMALGAAGDLDRAFAELDAALAAGYRDRDDLREGRFWAPLRGDQRWASTLRRRGLEP